jgi:hypothetical protein
MARHICWLSLGPFPPTLSTERRRLRVTLAWMWVSPNNGRTWDWGGGNCGRPSSPMPLPQPLLTLQKTHESAGLQATPHATSQAFGLPDPSPSVRGHRRRWMSPNCGWKKYGTRKKLWEEI